MIEKLLARGQRLLRRVLGIQIEPTLIQKCASFVACEKISGSYYEFGTYQGDSFIDAYRALKNGVVNRANHDRHLGCEKEYEARIKIWSEMRFYAFDSFEGLPELTVDDTGTDDFKAGQYSYDEERFKQRISKNGVDLNRVVTVPGWFADTCSVQGADLLDLDAAAIIWIDCDLYSSACDVMNIVNRIVQDGTIIVFDDWFTHKGHPDRGVQKAFNEWRDSCLVRESWLVSEYVSENWVRKAFIINSTDQKNKF